MWPLPRGFWKYYPRAAKEHTHRRQMRHLHLKREGRVEELAILTPLRRAKDNRILSDAELLPVLRDEYPYLVSA